LLHNHIHNFQDIVDLFTHHAPTPEAYAADYEMQVKYGAVEYHDAYQFTTRPEQLALDFKDELSLHDPAYTQETVEAIKATGGYFDEDGVFHKMMVGPHGRPLFIETPDTPAQHPNNPSFKGGFWDLHPVTPEIATSDAEVPPIPGMEVQHSIQGPNGSEEVAPAPNTPEVAKDVVPEVAHLSPTEYETAQQSLTASGAHPIEGWPEIKLDPTPDQIEQFRTTVAEQLGISPLEITDDAAREAIMYGGYSDHGHSFELWQGNDQMFVVERPTDDMHDIQPLETTKLPVLDVSDGLKDGLITDTAVLEDPTVNKFAGVNTNTPGTRAYDAWEQVQKFLVEHESAYGTGWRDPDATISLSDYLQKIGVFKD
jgi:hypothetical protein